MELKIKLKYSTGKAEDRAVFKTDDGLKLVFECDLIMNDMYITFSDGQVKKRYHYKNTNSADVPDCFYKAGELFIEVSLVARGEIAKTYIVEPIVIKEKDGELLAIEPYHTMRADIDNLKFKNSELTKTIITILGEIDFLKKQIRDVWENEEK